MAHTDRNINHWFWQNHYRGDNCPAVQRYENINGWSLRLPAHCEVCATKPHTEHWWNRRPGWFNTDCRRKERAEARNLLNRARAGNIDWDDLVIAYERPYY
jgi:hypothetical protein